MVAALASGPETPERHEFMQMAALANPKAAVTRMNRLSISKLLLVPNTAYRRGAWKPLRVERAENGSTGLDAARQTPVDY
jgi:hypothetical protein